MRADAQHSQMGDATAIFAATLCGSMAPAWHHQTKVLAISELAHVLLSRVQRSLCAKSHVCHVNAQPALSP